MTTIARRAAGEATANVALLATACVPIALVAGITGAAAIAGGVAVGIVLLSRAAGAFPRSLIALDALSGSSLLIGGVALCALAAQLLCAAARAEGTLNCARLCAAAFAVRPPPCVDTHYHGFDLSEINNAVIGTVYHPETQRTLQHPHGLVFLESMTLKGGRYFQDTSALVTLISQVAPDQAGTLARSFYAANAIAVPVRQAQRNFAEQIMLDSAQAEQFLTARTLAEVPLVITSTLPKPSPGDSVPGVLALSSAGVDWSSSMAIVLAVLRSPQSLARDHVEKARLVLTERHGLSWRVKHEWPAGGQ